MRVPDDRALIYDHTGQSSIRYVYPYIGIMHYWNRCSLGSFFKGPCTSTPLPLRVPIGWATASGSVGAETLWLSGLRGSGWCTPRLPPWGWRSDHFASPKSAAAASLAAKGCNTHWWSHHLRKGEVLYPVFSANSSGPSGWKTLEGLQVHVPHLWAQRPLPWQEPSGQQSKPLWRTCLTPEFQTGCIMLYTPYTHLLELSGNQCHIGFGAPFWNHADLCFNFLHHLLSIQLLAASPETNPWFMVSTPIICINLPGFRTACNPATATGSQSHAFGSFNSHLGNFCGFVSGPRLKPYCLVISTVDNSWEQQTPRFGKIYTNSTFTTLHQTSLAPHRQHSWPTTAKNRWWWHCRDVITAWPADLKLTTLWQALWYLNSLL